MFWDYVAGVYNVFANLLNKKVHQELCQRVEQEISDTDEVLECACGTGLLSGVISKKCKSLVASDFSVKMLEKAKTKYREYPNIEFRSGNILQIEYPDESFDVVVAANVIHLLEDPYKALSELNRVCRKGGKIIVPTYVNKYNKEKISGFVWMMGKAGANFKHQFTYNTYQTFIKGAGYENVDYCLIEGCVPCAVAVIMK